MPSANRITTPTAIDEAEVEGRYASLGDYTASFETFEQDGDPAPYFVGLPDDRCQCAHWGVVTAGQLTFRWVDHEETFMAGDAYFAPPGHLPLVTAGSRLWFQTITSSPPTEAAKVGSRSPAWRGRVASKMASATSGASGAATAAPTSRRCPAAGSRR